MRPDPDRVDRAGAHLAPRAERFSHWISIAAGVAALCAVGISWYQAELAREQQRASAWPFIAQANSYVGGPYTRLVENQGVGPARVRTFEVLVDDEPVGDWDAAMRALTGRTERSVYSSFGRGSVVPPGTRRTLLELPQGELAREFWTAAQTRLATVVCYCSVYDECWRADSREAEPVAIDACPAVALEFAQ